MYAGPRPPTCLPDRPPAQEILNRCSTTVAEPVFTEDTSAEQQWGDHDAPSELVLRDPGLALSAAPPERPLAHHAPGPPRDGTPPLPAHARTARTRPPRLRRAD